jgi:Fe-S cluster assembly protein SufD
VIEHFVSTDQQQNGFVNSLTELSLAAGARLDHCRINLEQTHLTHIGGVHGDLGRDAQLHAFTLAQGSVLKRIDYHMRHQGAGSFLSLNGVYLPYGQQLIDYHTNVEHCEPHGTTEQVFRGIIGGAARAVFNGRIHIHPDAQKTQAEMNNRNLLLTNEAEVDTKPELEIYADDVRCAHGATVTRPDALALYYLRSRGVSLAAAEAMLYSGFVNELIQDLPDAVIQNWLQAQLPQLLAQLSPVQGAQL